MSRNARLGLALVVVLVVMASAVATAGAYTVLTFNPAGSISQATLGPITYSGRFEEIELSASCSFTMRGTIGTAAVGSAARERVGSVTSSTLPSCSGAESNGVLNLPWDLKVVQLLPRGSATAPEAVTGIEVQLTPFSAGFGLFQGITRCLWRGALDAQATVTAAGTIRDVEGHLLWRYTIGLLSVTAASVLTRVTGIMFCAPTLTASGTLAAWSPAQEIRVR